MTQNRKHDLLIFLAGIAVAMLVTVTNAYGAQTAAEYGSTEQGLNYSLNDDKNGYTITDYDGMEPVVHIPAYINDLPVTEVCMAFQWDEVVTEVIFPETVKKMNYRCFEECPNLKKVNLGGLTEIDSDWHSPYLFRDCPQLDTLIFGEGADIEIIDTSDGYGRRFNIFLSTVWSQLKHIGISKTMTRVPISLFYGSGLETIEVESGHPDFKSVDNILYSADGKTLIVCGTSYKNEQCVIPEGVTTVSEVAFEGCSNIKTLTIPSSVTSIADNAFLRISPTLYVDKGSYAEQYAAEHEMSYLRYNEEGTLETPVTQIALDKEKARMAVGESLVLTAACSPEQATDKSVTWHSDNPNVAKVTEDGKVTAVKSGSAKITATAAGGCNVTASCSITVQMLDHITAAKTKTAYNINEALTTNDLTVTAFYSDGTSKAVTDYKTNAAKIDMATAGNKTLEVTYEENNVTKTAAVQIIVTKPGAHSAQTTSPTAAQEDKKVTAAKNQKPKKVTLKKVSSTKKGALKLTWKKDTKVTGYQAVVATDKKFKKNKKTATIKKNKTVTKTFTKLKSKKTYYAKVRAYKKSGKTKLYGAYSKVKHVKVK